MLIYLLRHGQTEYNAQKRYQGQRDIPLSAAGIAQLRQADFAPEVVYVTPLLRSPSGWAACSFSCTHARYSGSCSTCTKVWPSNRPKFISFSPSTGMSFAPGKNTRAVWAVRRSDFCNRVCKTLADLIDKALAEGQERLVIVAHGGTQMAALERFGVPRRSFHDWCGPNAGGYVLDARDWPEQHILHLVETVQYTKENG